MPTLEPWENEQTPAPRPTPHISQADPYASGPLPAPPAPPPQTYAGSGTANPSYPAPSAPAPTLPTYSQQSWMPQSIPPMPTYQPWTPPPMSGGLPFQSPYDVPSPPPSGYATAAPVLPGYPGAPSPYDVPVPINYVPQTDVSATHSGGGLPPYPFPDVYGGGGGDGGGGGGGGFEEVPPPVGSLPPSGGLPNVPPDIPFLLENLPPANPADPVWDIDANTQMLLQSSGLAPFFLRLLAALGFRPMGDVNTFGWMNDWLKPGSFTFGPEAMALLTQMGPAMSGIAQQIFAKVFGVSAQTEPVSPPELPQATAGPAPSPAPSPAPMPEPEPTPVPEPVPATTG